MQRQGMKPKRRKCRRLQPSTLLRLRLMSGRTWLLPPDLLALLPTADPIVWACVADARWPAESRCK